MGKSDYKSQYNFTPLAPNFIVGGRIVNKDNMRELIEDCGVTLIINCAMELDDKKLAKAVDKDVERFDCMWEDGHSGSDPHAFPPEDFLATLAWWRCEVAETLYDACALPVTYVHCNAGVHRGPVMMTFLLAALTGQDPKDVAAYIKARRPESDPWGVPEYRGAIKRALEVLGKQGATMVDDDDDD